MAQQQATELSSPAQALTAVTAPTRDTATTVTGNSTAHSSLDSMLAATTEIACAVQDAVTQIGTIYQNFVDADMAGGR
ncbi:TIGR04197 family type VII secretion effector [Rothia sp. P5766]|uniref:TIGR04197 family type VII secretion effector n=1 Tax=Rothia sp. P5766 TaxID=3402656 RepID=UPI003AE9E6F3